MIVAQLQVSEHTSAQLGFWPATVANPILKLLVGLCTGSGTASTLETNVAPF
jgi:hypothetical protein